MNKLSRSLVSASQSARTRRQCRVLPSIRHYTVPAKPTKTAKPPSPADDAEQARLYLEELQKHSQYPDLMKPDILMDLHESVTFPPSRFTPYENKVIVRNDPSMFLALREQLGEEPREDPEGSHTIDRRDEVDPLHYLHLSPGEINGGLYRYPLFSRRVVQQTGKGKVARQQYVVVVGNRDGMLGLGQGKSEDGPRALRQATVEAVRGMDHVERFEDRTVWTEMEYKFGSTRVIIRPRPVGFGLHVNPYIYHLLKAAGIKDASAKVWGSRNPLMVVHATMQMLMPGSSPLGMGNGIGGRGRRLDKHTGMRAPDDIARERGRKMVPVRTW